MDVSIVGKNRSQTFQALKPVCVRLSEVVLKFREQRTGSEDVVVSLRDLSALLKSLADPQPLLDRKLADYAFFPISHVFQEMHNLPLVATELAMSCVQSLLMSGWRVVDDPNFGLQLFLLLTHVGSLDRLSEGSAMPSEDFQSVALSCQALLYRAIKNSATVKSVLLDTPNIPSVGHAISMLLNCATESDSSAVQSSAVEALTTFQTYVSNWQITASFLPGIVSSLTQVLTPSTRKRRSYKVLVKSLELLQTVIELVLSDSAMDTTSRPKGENIKQEDYASTLQKVGGENWVRATSAQVKLALSNVAKLRNHDRQEVRDGLSALCLTVLGRCYKTLANSIDIMTETLTMLGAIDGDGQTQRAFEHIIMSKPDLGEQVRSSSFDCLVSLPRVMLSNDDRKKSMAIQNIVQSLKIMHNIGLDMSVIDSVLLNSLRDSVRNAITTPRTFLVEDSSANERESPMISTLMKEVEFLQEATSLNSILLTSTNSKEMFSHLEILVKEMSRSTFSLGLAKDYLDQAQVTRGEIQLVNFWLCLSIMRHKSLDQASINDFTNITEIDDDYAAVSDDMFLRALSILAEATTDVELDWRHQAVAIHAIAFQAQRLGEAFRMEMSDSLYAVVHLMGSQNMTLRSVAIHCLDVMAHSSGYADAKDLLISNVHYLVNAIGSQLNAGDISPQAPQVLIMMAKLCGPTLLPYLDDVIQNVFECLDYFHGYPTLVELLMSVLSSITVEAVKDYTLPNNAKLPTHESEPQKSRLTTIKAVSDELKETRAAVESRKSFKLGVAREGKNLPSRTPQVPWDEFRGQNSSQSGLLESNQSTDANEPTRSLSKNYPLVLRIATLTQHYLPSASPSLRISLISLLKQAIPYLSKDEDSFLPLVNTLWPVLIVRLSDSEAYVVSGILDIMGSFCVGAGNFMASRIQNVWPLIRDIQTNIKLRIQSYQYAVHNPPKKFAAASSARQVSLTSIQESQQRHQAQLKPLSSTDGETTRSALEKRPYVPTSVWMVRLALVRFLTTVLTCVHTSDSVFSEALSDLLSWKVDEDRMPDVQETVQRINADAVWLTLLRSKKLAGGSATELTISDTQPANVDHAPTFIKVLL